MLVSPLKLDDADVRRRLPLLDQDLQPLVSADEVAAALIPHQRFDAAELIDAPLELVVLRIAGLQVLVGVVGCWVDLIEGDVLEIRVKLPCKKVVRGSAVAGETCRRVGLNEVGPALLCSVSIALRLAPDVLYAWNPAQEQPATGAG